MSLKTVATTAAALIGGVWLVLAVLSFMPPESTHSHLAGPHDKMVLADYKPRPPVWEAVEPVYDVGGWIADFTNEQLGEDIASAHHPFPKFCGHFNAFRPNHVYYYGHSYWKNGYHYHTGHMQHAIGHDYNYTFRCGSRNHHYENWPQGWW